VFVCVCVCLPEVEPTLSLRCALRSRQRPRRARRRRRRHRLGTGLVLSGGGGAHTLNLTHSLHRVLNLRARRRRWLLPQVLRLVAHLFTQVLSLPIPPQSAQPPGEEETVAGTGLVLSIDRRTGVIAVCRMVTLHPTPDTLHQTPYTLHPTPYTPHHRPPHGRHRRVSHGTHTHTHTHTNHRCVSHGACISCLVPRQSAIRQSHGCSTTPTIAECRMVRGGWYGGCGVTPLPSGDKPHEGTPVCVFYNTYRECLVSAEDAPPSTRAAPPAAP